MLEIFNVGQDILELFDYLGQVIHTPIVEFEGFQVTLAGILIGGLVFALLIWRIAKFILP